MQCHGHLHARKMSPLSRQTLWLEDMAVDTWVPSPCGPVVMPRLQGRCTPPAWHTCTALACGWALATGRHTIWASAASASRSQHVIAMAREVLRGWGARPMRCLA